VAFAVPHDDLEMARARLLELHPEGFEEAEGELAVYTDDVGEARLRSQFGPVDTTSIEPGWEERWREFHRPALIGRLWVAPPWEEAPPDVIPVVIDPGRAFGTGSHPTTRLCLAFLLDLEPGRLVDVGCGSGVLSVAAAKLGFGPISAFDREEAAVEAAQENAARNGVTFEATRADVLSTDLPEAEVGFANIDLASVEIVGPRLRVETLVTAGYFHSRKPLLPGFEHVERRIDGGWAADRFRRQ
jgi:ribosomal protein L11 methyltransferase